MKKIKFKKSTLLKYTLLAAVFVVIAFLSYRFREHFIYSNTFPTANKFAMLKNWISDDSDLIVIADIYRLTSIPAAAIFLRGDIFGVENAVVKAAGPLFSSGNVIGMMAMNADFGDETGLPQLVVVIQGDFTKRNFLGLIKEELDKENISLSSEKSGETTIYWQGEGEEPFAFAMPDKYHLIVGTKGSVKSLIDENLAGRTKEFPFLKVNSPFFGALRSSDRIKRFLPPQVASLEVAKFATDDKGIIRVSMELPDDNQAENLKVFLQGMKALYLLQKEGENITEDIIDSINIGGEGDMVNLALPLENLLQMTMLRDVIN